MDLPSSELFSGLPADIERSTAQMVELGKFCVFEGSVGRKLIMDEYGAAFEPINASPDLGRLSDFDVVSPPGVTLPDVLKRPHGVDRSLMKYLRLGATGVSLALRQERIPADPRLFQPVIRRAGAPTFPLYTQLWLNGGFADGAASTAKYLPAFAIYDQFLDEIAGMPLRSEDVPLPPDAYRVFKEYRKLLIGTDGFSGPARSFQRALMGRTTKAFEARK